MNVNIKMALRTVVGALFVTIGVIFIILPGPAIIFIPLGFALLAYDHAWALVALRRSQKWMRQSAKKIDGVIYRIRRG